MFHIPTRKSVEHKKQKCCHPHKMKLGRCRYVHMCVPGCVCMGCVCGCGCVQPMPVQSAALFKKRKNSRTLLLSLDRPCLSFFPVLSVQSCVILRSDAPGHTPTPLLTPPHFCIVYENSICLSIFVSLILLDVRAAFKFHDELL